MRDDENKPESHNNNDRLRIETTLEATEAYTGAVDVDVGNLLVSETSVLEREKFSLTFASLTREERKTSKRTRETCCNDW